MEDLIKREDAIKHFKAKADHYRKRLARIEAQGDAISYDPTEQINGFKDEIAIYEDVVKELEGIPSAEELIYEEMEKADIEAQAYAKGFKEGLEARKQGEWISLHNGKWKCSECGIEVLIYAKGNFCPNCGARMK